MDSLRTEKSIWRTYDEIIFLKGIGGWKNPSTQDPRNNTNTGNRLQFREIDKDKRMRLLANYKTSIKLRKDWGNIVVGEVLEYLKTELISE